MYQMKGDGIEGPPHPLNQRAEHWALRKGESRCNLPHAFTFSRANVPFQGVRRKIVPKIGKGNERSTERYEDLYEFRSERCVFCGRTERKVNGGHGKRA
jgi:hypothetical protein